MAAVAARAGAQLATQQRDALADAEQRPRIVKLAVQDMPGSGTPAELLHAAKIDRDAIVEAVRSLVRVRD